MIPSTMISATVGVTALAAAHFVRWDLYGPVWMTWWTGDLVGGLVVAPLLIVWATRLRVRFTLPRLLEALALASVLIVLGDLIFIRWHSQYGQAEAACLSGRSTTDLGGVALSATGRCHRGVFAVGDRSSR